MANYTIQLGISDPSAIAPVLVGTAVPTGNNPDFYDDPGNGVNDNTLNPQDPVLVPGNQLNAFPYVAKAIYAIGDVDWTQFTLTSRSVVTLLAYNPYATVVAPATGIVGNHPAVPAIICVFQNSTSSQMTNIFDANSAFPSVQSKFSATLDPGTYYDVVYSYNNQGTILAYDLNDTVTPAPDTTPPTATISLASGQSSPTNASTVAFVAQFSKPVTGLSGAGIVLPSGVFTSVNPVNAANGYASAFNILVTGITSSGAVGIGIAANAAHDASNNGNVAVPAGPPVVAVDQNTLAGAYLFYKGSSFDRVSDNAALATDKAALLPGQTATFANYTSYSRGINGLMIDIAGLAGTLLASDLSFCVGNNHTPSSWAAAPAPLAVTTYPGQGVHGAARVVITWSDNAIQDEWLQVTVKGGPASSSGLLNDAVFYFGNAVGDSGNSASDCMVTAADEIATRVNATSSAGITNPYDYNRDGVVNAADELVAHNNHTNFATALVLLSSPAPAQGAATNASNNSSAVMPVMAEPVSTPAEPTTTDSNASVATVTTAAVSLPPAASVSQGAAIVPLVNAPPVAKASAGGSTLVPVMTPPVSTPAGPAATGSTPSTALLTSISVKLTQVASVSKAAPVIHVVKTPKSTHATAQAAATRNAPTVLQGRLKLRSLSKVLMGLFRL